MGAQESRPDAAGAGQVIQRTVKKAFWKELILELRRQHKQRHDRQFPAEVRNQMSSSAT